MPQRKIICCRILVSFLIREHQRKKYLLFFSFRQNKFVWLDTYLVYKHIVNPKIISDKAQANLNYINSMLITDDLEGYDRY